MGEFQKLISKMIGDDVSGSFLTNVGVATFSDDFTSYPTQARANAAWQNFGSPTALAIRVNITTDVIDWDFENNGLPIGHKGVTFDLFKFGKMDARGSLALVGNWAMRFKINFGSGLVSPTVETNEGTVGLFDALSTASDVVQSFIAYKFSMDSGGSHDIALITGDVATTETPTTTNTFETQFASDTTLFLELKRTADGNIEGTIYSDSDYSVIIEKIKVTGVATAIDDLRYMRVNNKDSVGDGNFKGTLDETELFNESEGLQNFFTAKGDFKTVNFDVIPDLITGQNVPDFIADLFVTTGWVDSGASEVRQLPDAGLIECLVDADGGQDGITNDILGQTISDTAWVLRGSFQVADFLAGAAQDKTLFVGMFPGTQPPTLAQDSIFFAITTNSVLGNKNGKIGIGHSDGALPQNATIVPFTNDVFNPMKEGKYFFELKRTSATTVECTLFDERGFSFPLQTIFQTIPATVVGLRFISLQAIIAAATGRITMYFDEFEFFDGVTNACTFNTAPVLEQDTTESRMNYCNASIVYSGFEDDTNNSISVDLGVTLSDSAFVMRCKIDVQNFNIQASPDRHWLGLFDLDSASAGPILQSGIALRADTQNNAYNATANADTILENWGAETTYTGLIIVNGVFYLEIVRLSSTQARISLFRDKDFNDLIESRTFTIPATINDLRFFAIKNRIDPSAGGVWNVIVSNIQIWDNVTNADGFPELTVLEVFTTGNRANGVQEGHYHMNSDTQTGNYVRRNEQNQSGSPSNSEVETFLRTTITNFSESFMDYLRINNQSGFAKYTWGEKTWNGGDGVALPPNRVEHCGHWGVTIERLNKIHVFNSQASGDFDTDSNLIVFGAD